MTLRVIWTKPRPKPEVGVSAMVDGKVLMPLRCGACRSSDWVPPGKPPAVARSLGWTVGQCQDGSLLLTCPGCSERQPLRAPQTRPRAVPMARHAAT